MVGLWADKLDFTALDSLTSFRIDEVLVDFPARSTFEHAISDTPVVVSFCTRTGKTPLFCGGWLCQYDESQPIPEWQA